MNRRIRNKVYNRANDKLLDYIREHNDKRTTLEIELQEKILTPLERRVFLKQQARFSKLFEEIKNELIAEGTW